MNGVQFLTAKTSNSIRLRIVWLMRGVTMRISTGQPVSSTETMPPVAPVADAYTQQPAEFRTIAPVDETAHQRRGLREILTDRMTYSPSALKARWDEHRLHKAAENHEAFQASAHESSRRKSIIGAAVGTIAVAVVAYLETKHGGNRFDWLDTSLYVTDLSPVAVERPSQQSMDSWWQVGQRPAEAPNLAERLWHMDKHGYWLWDGPAFENSITKDIDKPDPIPPQDQQPGPGPTPEKPDTGKPKPNVPTPTLPAEVEWTPQRGGTLWDQSEDILNAAGVADRDITDTMRWEVINAIDAGNASITDPDVIYAGRTYDMREGIEVADKYRRLMSDLVHHIEEDTRLSKV
jgi:hypothetical protein